MKIVTSPFIIRKTQNVEPAQAHTEPQNAPEIERKYAYYTIVLTHCKTNNISIEKKVSQNRSGKVKYAILA